MKFLCFSDLHRDAEAAAKLVAAAEQADIVIGAGDFGTRRKGLADTLELLQAIDRPAVLVPGNGESVEELREAAKGWKQARVLHGDGCQIDGIEFWGVGGGIPTTPFGEWSYDFDEAEAERLLSDAPSGGIFVVHSPPLDTVDHDSSGQIRGSRSIRDAVEAKEPRLVVCGHIHSDWEKEVTLGPTRVLNAGPRGVKVELV